MPECLRSVPHCSTSAASSRPVRSTSFARYERDRGLPEGFLRGLNATNHDSNAWARHERNEVTFDEFCAAYEAEALAAGGRSTPGRSWRAWRATSVPRCSRRSARCHERLKTALITNNVATTTGQQRARCSTIVDGLFDVVVESSKTGLRKPDPAHLRADVRAARGRTARSRLPRRPRDQPEAGGTDGDDDDQGHRSRRRAGRARSRRSASACADFRPPAAYAPPVRSDRGCGWIGTMTTGPCCRWCRARCRTASSSRLRHGTRSCRCPRDARRSSDRAARRNGIDRRRFLLGAGGLAASLADVRHGLLGGPQAGSQRQRQLARHRAAPPDPSAFRRPRMCPACAQALNTQGEFIFDVHTHHVMPGAPWRQNAPDTVQLVLGMLPPDCAAPDQLDCVNRAALPARRVPRERHDRRVALRRPQLGT